MDKGKLMAMHEEDLDLENAKEEHRTIKVPNSLCYSIFVALCCCTPLGIAAMVMSLHSHDSIASGKYGKATSRARLSRKMSHIALGLGLLVWVLVVIIIIVEVMMVGKVMGQLGGHDQQNAMQQLQEAMAQQEAVARQPMPGMFDPDTPQQPGLELSGP